jgi:hypothetical protein
VVETDYDLEVAGGKTLEVYRAVMARRREAA